MPISFNPLEDQEQQGTFTPQTPLAPEQSQQVTPESVAAITIAEDVEDVRNISAGLLRAYEQQRQEVPGALPSYTGGDKGLAIRAEEIEKAVGRVPGEEKTIGLARDVFSLGKFFVDNIVGVANTIAVPLGLADTGTAGRGMEETLFTKPQKVYDKERYVKYYDNLRKKEDDWWFPDSRAALLTAYKIFDESPELKSEGEFVKGVIDRLAGQVGTVSVREADALTGYWRPEASITEQVIRAIPEAIGATAAGVKFLTRGNKKYMKQAEKILKEQTGKDSLLEANSDDIIKVVEKMMGDEKFAIANAFKLGHLRARFFGERMAANIAIKQMPQNLKKASDEIRAAKGKLATARTSGDKQAILREQAALRVARQQRSRAIPKQLLEVPLTEAGAVTGAIIGGNLLGEEYGALIGALGGGFGSAFGFEKMYDFASGSLRGFGSIIAGVGQAVGALDNDQIKILATKGIIGDVGNLTRNQQKALKSFSTFIRSLPQDARESVFSQIKFFSEVRNDLAAAGVDPELLDTTIGKATGLVPLMMMREAISSYNLDMSRRIKTLDKDLAIIIGNESNIIKQVEELRGLVDRLAGAAGDAGIQNEKFNGFIDAMRNMASRQKSELYRDKANVDRLVQNVLDKISDPLISQNIKDQESLNDLIRTIMQSRYLDEGVYGADEAVRQLREEAIPDFEEAAEGALKQVEDKAVKQDTALFKFLTGYLNPKTYQKNAEGAAGNLAHYAGIKNAQILTDAGRRFEELKNYNIEVDITNWLDDLYNDGDLSRAYDAAVPKDRSKIRQKLAKKNISNAETLDAFSNVEGKINVQKAIDNNPELKKELVSAIQEARIEGMENVSIDNVTYENIKDFLNIEYNRPSNSSLSDFDVFRILRDTSKELDLGDLRITVSLYDIQQLSSGFSAASRKLYDSDQFKKQSEKLGTLAKTIVDTIDENKYPEAAGALKTAKENWINNVVMRYRDKDGNPLGYNVEHFNPNGTFKTKPVKWIDMRALLSGDTQYGADILDQLEKTFGSYQLSTGEYVLSGEDKEIIRNLMNDLLARSISEQRPVRIGRKLIEGIPLEAELGDAERIREGRSILKSRGIGAEYMGSAALDILEGEGILDLDRVVQYNLAVDNFLGDTAILTKVQNDVQKQAKIAATRVKDLSKERESFLKETMGYLPTQEGARQVEDFDRFMQFFVFNPRGTERYEQIVPEIAKTMKIDETKAREIFSDLTIESIARATYQFREARAGEVLRDFNVQGFYELVSRPETAAAIRNIVGDEKFNGITRVAQMLMIQNRDINTKLRESGINITTPRGLSVESLLSRTYSVARGVISPKYVATEVALLGFRKKKAQALSEILNDPKTVDYVIDIIESGGADIRKFNNNLFVSLINGLGYYENSQKQQRTRQQIKQLELEQLRR